MQMIIQVIKKIVVWLGYIILAVTAVVVVGLAVVVVGSAVVVVGLAVVVVAIVARQLLGSVMKAALPDGTAELAAKSAWKGIDMVAPAPLFPL